MRLFPESIDLNELNARWVPTMDKHLGLAVTAIGENSLTAEFTVTEITCQPFGIMHGGMSCVVGESLGSVAGSLCLKDPSQTVVGQSLFAVHLRPARLGTRVRAVAEPRHIGRGSQVWEILLQDKDEGKPISKVTLTLAVVTIRADKQPGSSS